MIGILLIGLAFSAAARAVTIGPGELYRAEGPAAWHRIAPAPQVQPLKTRAPTAGEQRAVDQARAAQSRASPVAIVLMDGNTVVHAWQRNESARVYWGASVGKSVLAIAVGQAICAGKLQLTTKVREFAPEAASHPVADATVRDLLRMAGGMTASVASASGGAKARPA